MAGYVTIDWDGDVPVISRVDGDELGSGRVEDPRELKRRVWEAKQRLGDGRVDPVTQRYLDLVRSM